MDFGLLMMDFFVIISFFPHNAPYKDISSAARSLLKESFAYGDIWQALEEGMDLELSWARRFSMKVEEVKYCFRRY